MVRANLVAALGFMLSFCLYNATAAGGYRKSANFFYGGPAFRTGGPLGPQQNIDGLWTFVAVPIPLENQTFPEGDFPIQQIAQAKLWGPVYRPGHGWVYGEAGMILVPRMPPYVPPTIIPPPPPSPPTRMAGPEDAAPALVLAAETSSRGPGSMPSQPAAVPSTAAKEMTTTTTTETTERSETEQADSNASDEKNVVSTNDP